MTSTIGVTPAKIRSAGEPMRSGELCDDSWEIRASSLTSSASRPSLDGVLGELWRALLPRWTAFVNITRTGAVEVECAIYEPQAEPYPDLVLEPDSLRKLGEINASVQISIY